MPRLGDWTGLSEWVDLQGFFIVLENDNDSAASYLKDSIKRSISNIPTKYRWLLAPILLLLLFIAGWAAFNVIALLIFLSTALLTFM